MTATKTPAFHKPPLFTRQQLIALLLPLIAEQALSVTIGLADTLMVSSVGEAAVSGVSLWTASTPDDPDHERPCHRRRGGHQPVHRPAGAKGCQECSGADPVHPVQLQPAGGRRCGGGPPCHPARHLRLHRRGRDALCRDLLPALGPELPVHRPVQRRCGPVPGAGQQQDQHDVQPCNECGEHWRQRRADLRLQNGRDGCRTGQPCVPRHCLRGCAVPAAAARLPAAGGRPAGPCPEGTAHPADPAGGHPCRY